MPPKRKHDNVDVDEDEEGEGEDDVKTIWIVSPSTEKREQFMCELCSSVLKSAASLVRHKKRHQESRLESDDKYNPSFSCFVCPLIDFLIWLYNTNSSLQICEQKMYPLSSKQ